MMPTSRKPAERSSKTLPPDRRIAGSYLLPLLETAQERGVSTLQLANACNVSPEMLAPQPENLPAELYVRLLDAGAQLANDPHFGLHVGEHVKLGTYNVYGLILLSCKDFGHALQQTMRFESLAHELGRSELGIHGDQAQYRWLTHFEGASRHLVESVFAGIRVFGNWLAGRPIPAGQIQFRHQAPEATEEYSRIFGVMPEFCAGENMACFDASLLAWPVPNADVALYPVLQKHAEQLLKEKNRVPAVSGIVGQVRARIIDNLSSDRVRVAHIALDLQMTQRTLQRKLQDAGVSYQQLLDATRYELAKEYLEQDDLSLAEVAFMLGFQEQSSFHHAFKEWSGVNPGAYRQRNRLAKSDRL